MTEEESKAEKAPKEDVETPFARAQVVRVMRDNLADDKMIKKEVKQGMNLFLGKVCKRVTKKLNKYPYAMIDYRMFEEAKEDYENIEKMEKEKKRVIKHLEAIKGDCNRLITDLEESIGEEEYRI